MFYKVPVIIFTPERISDVVYSPMRSSVSRVASNAFFLRFAKTFLIIKATVAVPTMAPATPHPTATARTGDVNPADPS